jgi:hypothetical protein
VLQVQGGTRQVRGSTRRWHHRRRLLLLLLHCAGGAMVHTRGVGQLAALNGGVLRRAPRGRLKRVINAYLSLLQVAG